MTVHSVQPITGKFEKRKKRASSFIGTPAERIRQKATAARIANLADGDLPIGHRAFPVSGSVAGVKEDHVEN